jgi:hypothetical protein
MVFMALVVKYKTDAGVEGPALPSAVAITYRQEGEFPHPLTNVDEESSGTRG